MEFVVSVLAFFGIVYVGLVQLSMIVIGLVFFYLVFIWPIISLIIVEVGGAIDARKIYKQQLKNKQKDKEK